MTKEESQSVLKVLEHALSVIRSWHDLNAQRSRKSPTIIEEIWLIYYNNAPEMKSIREAINEFKK